MRLTAGTIMLVGMLGAALALPAFANQQSNSTTAAPSSGHSNSTKNATDTPSVRQEYGPQAASRRGDRMGVVSPNGQGNGGHGSSTPGAVKQEFGPQSVPRRGDRMSAVTPNGPGNHGAQGTGQGHAHAAREHWHQEFGPTQASKRNREMRRGGNGPGGAGHHGGPEGGAENQHSR